MAVGRKVFVVMKGPAAVVIGAEGMKRPMRRRNKSRRGDCFHGRSIYWHTALVCATHSITVVFLTITKAASPLLASASFRVRATIKSLSGGRDGDKFSIQYLRPSSARSCHSTAGSKSCAWDTDIFEYAGTLVHAVGSY